MAGREETPASICTILKWRAFASWRNLNDTSLRFQMRSSSRGTRTENTLPVPNSLITSMFPPGSSGNCLTSEWDLRP